MQVASLYASISADLTGLEKGLKEARGKLNATGQELGNLDKNLSKTETQSKKTGVSFTQLATTVGVVTGVVTAMGVAAKKAFDFTEQGAAVAQTRESFDRLGVSLDELRGKSLGTVDDMTLMSSALTLAAGAGEALQGHLMAAAPQLLEIAKAANAVNPSLGNTAFMYESIAKGIKRSSPLILDNLGIVVKIGEANEAYAAQLGKTVAELSAEEKQIALLNGTIAAGNRLIEQAGGSAAAYGDAWAAVRAEIKNTTDELKANASTVAGPVVGNYAALLKLTRENELGLIGFGAAARMATSMLGGSGEAVLRVGAWMDILTGNTDDAAKALVILNKEEDQFSDKLARSGDATKAMTLQQKLLTAARLQEIVVLKGMADNLEDNRGLTSSMVAYQAKLARTTGDSAIAWDQYSDAIARSEQATADYAQAQWEAAEAAAAAGEMARTSFGVDSNLTESLEEGRDRLRELRDEFGELEAQLAAGDLTPDELDALKTKMGEVKSEIYGVIDGMREMSARFVLGLIEMQIAADDKITETEAAIYTQFAYHSGLIDKLAVQQSDAVMGILADMNAGIITEHDAMRLLLDDAFNLSDAFIDAEDAGATSMSNIAASTSAPTEGLGRIEQAARDAQAMIDAMQGKTITLNVNTVYTEEHRSAGAGAGESSENWDPNWQGAAGGVSGGGLSLVGEQGPELVNLPQGAQVMSNPVTNNVTNNFNTTVSTRATSGTYAQDIAAFARAMG